MKQKISKLLIITLVVSMLTVSVSAISEKYAPYDEIIKYEDYLKNNDSTTREFNGRIMIGLLVRRYNLDMGKLADSTIKSSYYTRFWHLETVTRLTMLIDIMRINMLIPDPDSTDIIEYPWTDIPNNITKQELAYVNYAKQLGITNGTSEFTFGFTTPATYEQFDAFANNIAKIENIDKYKAVCPITVIDNSYSGQDKWAIPIIVEYFNTLPDKLVEGICTYTFYIDDYRIEGYSQAVGLTRTDVKTVEVLGTHLTTFNKDFTETMIHEFGHVVNDISGINLIRGVENYATILNDEMPKLGRVYRSYATTDKYEFFACAWYYQYLVGDTIFTNSFPETSILFNKIIDMYN